MDRVLVYLGFFLAAFLVTQTEEKRQRFAEGLAASVVLVALLGLAPRLLPHVLTFGDQPGDGARMHFPLGYWNANGAVFGIALVLALWLSRNAREAISRWLAVAAMPIVLLALYFTYSRGGLLALLVGVLALLALSRDRLWLLVSFAAALLCTLPAILAAQARADLANNVGSGIASQGAVVALILLGGIALALALERGRRRLEAVDGRRTGKAVEFSRNPVLLRALALLAVAAAVAAAVAVGGRAWGEFSRNDVRASNDPAQHFTDLSGAGRSEFWGVALDEFADHPLLGTGAGTYVFSWQQQRTIDLDVHDAHSLYLEAFSELGVFGGILVLALVGGLLYIGLQAWRHATAERRERCAALLAAMLAFAVGAALDWFWELPALGGVFFLAAGVLVCERCRQLNDQAVGGDPGPGEQRRFDLTIAALAAAWVAALALIGPLLVEHEIEASQSAAAAGNFASAVDHADTARSIEPWAATPYVQLGLLAELRCDYGTAHDRFSDAIAREDHNWQLYYLRSRVELEAGEAAASRADYERARELDPLAPELQAQGPVTVSCQGGASTQGGGE